MYMQLNIGMHQSLMINIHAVGLCIYVLEIIKKFYTNSKAGCRVGIKRTETSKQFYTMKH